MEYENTAVTACDLKWGIKAGEFKTESTLLQFDHREMILNTGVRYLRILHPSMLNGKKIVGWDFWCRHHLSEKQLERLDEILPTLCNADPEPAYERCERVSARQAPAIQIEQCLGVKGHSGVCRFAS